MERARRRTWMFVGVLSLLLITSSIPGAIAATPVTTAAPNERSAAVTSLQEDTGANNSSVQHENPDVTNENGDLAAVRKWLANDLSSYLEGSTLQLSQGQYEAARRALGDDYSDSLGKFVDVTGETQESTDNEDSQSPEKQKKALNETRNTQREYIDTAESFQETYEAYQEAKEAGNESRARELARRLKAQGDRVAELTTALRSDYRTVETITGTSLTTALERINQTTANITERSEAVIVAEFVETRLTVSQSSTRASFTNPVTITGTIETPNASTPPPNGTITLQVGDRRLETSVSAAGTFSIEYRPVTTQTGEQEINLQYVPQADSIYLDSTATTRLTVTAVTPTIEVEDADQALRFAQSTDISGRVTVNETAVPGLPVTVQIAGVTIQTLKTGPNGGFQSSAPLPAIIASGIQPLSVQVAQENRAIRATTADQTVRVAETQTNLSLDGTWDSNGASVSGKLTTVDGVPAPNQPVRIIVNGTHKTTTQTTGDGTFRTSFEPSRQPVANATLNVTAVYVASGTNLANATGQTRLKASIDSATNNIDQSNSGTGDDNAVQKLTSQNSTWFFVGLAGVGLVGGLYWWRRRSTSTADEVTQRVQSTSETTPAATPTEEQADDPSPLEPAIVALDSGDDPDNAVRLAFSTVRETLVDAENGIDVSGGPMPVTHWEFYRAYKDVVPDAVAFEELTDAYERATYAQEALTEGEASTAITIAEDLVTALSDEDDASPTTPDRK